jgi:hypothetical protein
VQDVTREQFPLPTVGPKILAIREELLRGRGFQLIKGVPVDKWTRRQVVIAYWGIGLYLGRALSNNKKGHLVCTTLASCLHYCFPSGFVNCSQKGPPSECNTCC